MVREGVGAGDDVISFPSQWRAIPLVGRKHINMYSASDGMKSSHNNGSKHDVPFAVGILASDSRALCVELCAA